jgi:ankyrin repeat protein
MWDIKDLTLFGSALLVFLTSLLLNSCAAALDRDLVSAAAQGDAMQVKSLLDRGANIEAHARDDWTPLTVAAREGHLKTVELLLERGADVNAREGGGHTALFWADKYDRTEVAVLLRSKGGKLE